MKMLLIINPTSGTKKGKTSLFDILNIFCKAGYEVTCELTLRKGHATELAKSAEGRFDKIVCMGGDGTLNEVVSGIMQMKNKLQLGYIPAGTTNDFASSANISTNIKTAAHSIVNGKEHKIDIGRWNDRCFSYIASFGAFTAVSYKVPQVTKNTFGRLAYILQGITDLGSLQPYHLRLECQEKILQGNYVFGAISNSSSIGGILNLDKSIIDMNDGFFEVALIKYPKNTGELNRIIWGLINSDFSSDIFEFFKTSQAKIFMDEKIPWTLDGEGADGVSEISVKNVKDAITLIK